MRFTDSLWDENTDLYRAIELTERAAEGAVSKRTGRSESESLFILAPSPVHNVQGEPE